VTLETTDDLEFTAHILNNIHSFGPVHQIMTKINHDNKGLLMNVKESLHICLYNKKGHFIDEQKQAENSICSYHSYSIYK
jgi:hypothetical protein